MFHKKYAFLGLLLILINIVALILLWKNPFLIFSPQSGIFGYDPLILTLIVMGTGFLDYKFLRWPIALTAVIMWAIIFLISYAGNLAAILRP